MSALEKGLAWLKENLDLRLPRVSRDILKLSAVDLTELASPIGAAASLGGGRPGSGNRTAAEESGVMVRAFESYRAVPRGVTYMFSTFLGAYVLVVTVTVLLIINRGLPHLCRLRRKGSKRGLREGRQYRPDSGTSAQMISYCRSIVQIS